MNTGDVIAGKRKKRRIRKEFIVVFFVDTINYFYLFYWQYLF